MSLKQQINIPRNHKRSLSVTSRHVERNIDEIEDLLLTTSREKSTEIIHKNLDKQIIKKILELLSLLRIQNIKMFEELELDPLTSYENRIVRGKVSHIWTLLCDSTSESLKGFGPLSKEQAEKINNHINILLDTINKIQTLL